MLFHPDTLAFVFQIIEIMMNGKIVVRINTDCYYTISPKTGILSRYLIAILTIVQFKIN